MTIELLNVDCMEYMATLPDAAFDLAIVDPPYGVGMDRCMKGSTGIDKRDGKPIQRKDYVGGWDSERPPKEYFSELFRVSKAQFIWGGNFFADLLPASTHWIFWDKQNPMPSFGDGELCYTSSHKKSIRRFVLPYWGHQTAGEVVRIHPTQKPVRLYEWLLQQYATQGQRILDTHLGSGSSAIAAAALGFQFVGCELDGEYFHKACKRIADAQAQPRLFEDVKVGAGDTAVQGDMLLPANPDS